MLKVGISGKIAAGKSEVEKILQELGFCVFDLDIIAHNLYENEHIKKEILAEFNTFKRSEIASIVFNDNNKKKNLENIIYPQLKKEILNVFEENKSKKAIFISGALIFKTGFYKLFDKTIFIEADDEIRLKRLINRNNISIEEAKKRLNLQDDRDLADFIIENNADKNSLKNEIEKVLKLILK